jgi:S-adenosylmethionine-diacylglycerol 3-amino-3-carboxypropyl transferase
MTAKFTATLNYSSVNEDWRTEAAALRVGPGDAVLAITGGGRPLDLLALDPGRVLAVDFAAPQNALLELEVAAIRRLPFEDYARFIGLTESDRRWRIGRLVELLPDLTAGAAAYWGEHARAVARGVLYQGRWERFFRVLSLIARAARPREVRELMACTDLDAQRRFLSDRWDARWWRVLHRVALSGPVLRLLYGDPAFYAHVDVQPGDHVYDRMRASLARTLARESFMVSLVLTGRLSPLDLPPHLTPEGTARIRERLDRLEIVTADVVTFLARDAPARSFSAFSLSDVPSYLDAAGFLRLLAGVERCAAPGARFCIRLFLSRPHFPEELAGRLVRDPELEARLTAEDHGFAYDFIAGHVSC